MRRKWCQHCRKPIEHRGHREAHELRCWKNPDNRELYLSVVRAPDNPYFMRGMTEYDEALNASPLRGRLLKSGTINGGTLEGWREWGKWLGDLRWRHRQVEDVPVPADTEAWIAEAMKAARAAMDDDAYGYGLKVGKPRVVQVFNPHWRQWQSEVVTPLR